MIYGYYYQTNPKNCLYSNCHGVYSYDENVMKTLEKCTGLTTYRVYGQGTGTIVLDNLSLNLSELTELKEFAMRHIRFKDVKFPSSLIAFHEYVHGGGELDFSDCVNLEYVFLCEGKSQTNDVKSLKSLNKIGLNGKTCKLNYIGISSPVVWFFNNLENLNNCTNLNEIYVEAVHWRATDESVTNLAGFKKLTNLENLNKITIKDTDLSSADLNNLSVLKYLTELNLIRTGINDISFIGTALSPLEKVNFSENKIIKGIKGLENVKITLESCDLNTNKIENQTTDSFGTYRASEVLADLNQNRNGNLKYLNILDNPNFSDVEVLQESDLSWSLGKKGF